MNTTIFLKSGELFDKVKISQIVKIFSTENYSEIQTDDNQKYITKMTISEWESFLIDKNFIRIQRSHIVNRNIIDTIDLKNNLINTTFGPLKIGRAYKIKLIADLSCFK